MFVCAHSDANREIGTHSAIKLALERKMIKIADTTWLSNVPPFSLIFLSDIQLFHNEALVQPSFIELPTCIIKYSIVQWEWRTSPTITKTSVKRINRTKETTPPPCYSSLMLFFFVQLKKELALDRLCNTFPGASERSPDTH